MSNAGNQEHAETVGLALSIISIAQLWPELPAQMKRFFEPTFLVVHRDEAQVSECWSCELRGKAYSEPISGRKNLVEPTGGEPLTSTIPSWEKLCSIPFLCIA